MTFWLTRDALVHVCLDSRTPSGKRPSWLEYAGFRRIPVRAFNKRYLPDLHGASGVSVLFGSSLYNGVLTCSFFVLGSSPLNFASSCAVDARKG